MLKKKEEHELYKNLFVNRTDIYARQLTDGRYKKVNSTLTDDILHGVETIGLYQLKNNTVKWACIDIDVNKEVWSQPNFKVEDWEDKIQEQAMLVKQLLKAKGMIGYREGSGFKGEHVWVFFAKPVQAGIVKSVFDSIFMNMPIVDKNMHYEIFPKQAEQNGTLGNLVKAPLQVHLKSKVRSYFIDDDGNEINGLPGDINKVSKDLIEKLHIENVPNKKTVIKSSGPTPTNIDRMETYCEAVSNMITKAAENHHLSHEERINLAPLYKAIGEPGMNRFYEIFENLDDFNRETTDTQLASLTGEPTRCSTICGVRKCEKAKACGYESPIGFAYQKEPGDIYEKRGRYLVKMKKGEDKVLTEWVIKPIGIIDLGDKDVLHCTIISTKGTRFNNVYLESEAWHSRQKLLRALGHTELTVHGSDHDVQNLAHFIVMQIKDRVRGVGYIGVVDDTFVADGINISKSEISLDPKIKVYIKGKDSLLSRIQIKSLNDEEKYRDIVKGIYKQLPNINEAKTIYPLISWLYLLPLKTRFVERLGAFPIAHGYGEMGNGKTSTGEIGLRMYGYTDPKVFDCRMTSFSLLSLLSSTNTIPVILDEYRGTNMKEQIMKQIIDRLRGLYKGEYDSRGHADQTLTFYKLRAPVMVLGEYKISDPAILERTFITHFGRRLKSVEGADYRRSYHKLIALPLERFAAEYIKWVLDQDIESYMAEAKVFIDEQYAEITISPRVMYNWQVLFTGLKLWENYGKFWQVPVKDVPFEAVFNGQKQELDLSDDGKVKRDIEKLIEYMAILVERGCVTEGVEYGWKDGYLLIHVESMLDAVRKQRRLNDSDIYVMDKTSFKNQAKDSDYYEKIERAMISKVQKWWVWLDYDKLFDAELDVGGFCNPPEKD